MKYYVTKWVIARGILHVEGSKPYTIRGSASKFVHARVEGWRRQYPLRVGSEAFKSLDDAMADAKLRFEEHLRYAQTEYTYAKRALQLIQQGKGPVVHHAPLQVKHCHAFNSTISGL